MHSIDCESTHFTDDLGRTVMLRGVNLGGSSKVPRVPDGATHQQEGFFDHRRVSFVGRPFPLEEAAEHLGRLQSWGFNFLRLLVPWEAVEHAGPGDYDQAYLEYLRRLVEVASTFGFYILVDPHQDVWSRFSGGDGAPGWTFEAAGMDLRNFHQTGAAILHQIHGEPFPRMIWPTNSGKLAAATMFTLFFGSNHFSPQCRVDGEPIQQYLQRHYLNAMAAIAKTLAGLPNVIGYDTMNEPLPGYIGCRDLEKPWGLLQLGPCPTPLQSMALGEGLPQEVDVWALGLRGARIVSQLRIDPQGQRAWLAGRPCLWREAGVWDLDGSGTPRALRPAHFAEVNGKRVDFARDYFKPFARRFAQAIQSVDPQAAIFLEPPPRETGLTWGPQDAPRCVFAPHWYDGYVLFSKSFHPHIAVDMFTERPIFGAPCIRRAFAAQLERLKQIAARDLGGIPTVIGEFGIPFDLDGGKAFHSGDYRRQMRAMDRSFRAIEDSLLSCALWNYTADNTHAHGDGWNGEDLSIFCADEVKDASDENAGGRALAAVVRPYPRAVAGEPLRIAFDPRRRIFEFEFRHHSADAPTEIFLPRYQYPQGCRIEVSDGWHEADSALQLLRYFHTPTRERHWLRIRPR